MRAAFTLIELLAVVAVIAILAVILIPVIGMARDSAIRTRCLNNLRQFGVAAHTYAVNQPDGRLPPCNMQNPSGSASSWPWKRFISEYLEKELAANQTNQWDPATMRCPVFRARNPTALAWFTGYGMNTRLLFNKNDHPRNERQSHHWSETTTTTHPLKGYVCGFPLDPITQKERRVLFMCGNEYQAHFVFTASGSGWNDFGNSDSGIPNADGSLSVFDATRHRKLAPAVFVSGRTAALSRAQAILGLTDPVNLDK